MSAPLMPLSLASPGAELLRRIGAFGRPLDVSANGWRGDLLFGWISLVIAIVLAIVFGQLLLVLLRRRSAPSVTRGDERGARLLVVGTTLALFCAVDGVALMRGGEDLEDGVLRRPAETERPIDVEVLAQQWAWSFRLAGADGRFGTDDDIVTLHELRLPAGRPARLQLRSKDVIHSLFLPQFRAKRDAQPGVTTELLLEPTRSGHYEIACAQHCGLNHYKMRGTLEVIDEDAFSRYAREESQRAAAQASSRTSDGNWGWDFSAGAGR